MVLGKFWNRTDLYFQVLNIPELDFTIHQLEISPDGQYLAIVGEKRVAVCLLPSPGFVRSSDEKLRAVSVFGLFRLYASPY